ncbi:putative glycoside hydrolase [Patescibacteria group bacterium]
MKILRIIVAILVVGLIAFLTTFQKSQPIPTLDEPPVETPEIVKIALDPDNPPRIPILEYHNFGEIDSRWTRSFDTFYNDLLWLYNNDFRPVTVDEFIAMDFSRLEFNKRPFVLTFDDASMDQFTYHSDETVNERSAVGVLDQFVQDYPDFGPQATFFVLPGGFGQPGRFERKIEYLLETGREVASHTYYHDDLSETSAEDIRKTLQEAEDYIGFEMTSLAYPNGLYPDGEEEMAVIDEFVDAAFLVGARPSRLPNDPEFDAMMIPRIQAIDEEWIRHFNRESGEIERSEKSLKFNPFVAGIEYIDEQPLPYEECASFEYTPANSGGKTLWKYIEYKWSKFQVNKPKDLTFKNGKHYYKITGEEEVSIAEKFLSNSRHYRVSDFKEVIIEANPDANFEADEEVVIPDIPLFFVKQKTDAEQPWGVYLTAYSATSDEGPRIIDQMKENGGQLIVFDVKEIDGHVYFETDEPLASQDRILYPDLDNYVRYWHEKGIYLAARIVIFKDITLSANRPDLAIQSSGGGPWANREGVVWLDPSNEETQDYILGLVEELAMAGIDEIQFDYIRFPTLGPVSQTDYNFDEANMEKYEVIRNFIVRVNDRLKPYESKLSLDVYGVIVWNNEYDSRSTGQKMACLGPYIDVVYPMVYPSHFGPGFGGHANPGDAPYYFVSESIKLFEKYLEGTDTEIRPWLQAFAWRVNNYGQWYIDEQVKATNDEGWQGYALWNAGNNYTY